MKFPYFFYKPLSFPSPQITRTLPRRFWDRVIIHENKELMIKYGGSFVRKTVAQKLDQVKTKLPAGISLKIIEGYRPMEKQKVAWDRKWDVVKSENPDWSDEQIESEVKLVVARPAGITNHICGGAVDVALINSEGDFLDFGTEYAAADLVGRCKCPMFAKKLTDEQKQNRKILRTAMESAGFVWYPGEWWHYCYGDRMWAVYTGRKECFYGPVVV